MRVYAYLRASTKEQNAERSKDELQKFVDDHGLKVAYWFIENESGANLNRPELLRALAIAQPNDIILVEQIDRISRLNTHDWHLLRKQIRIRDSELFH